MLSNATMFRDFSFDATTRSGCQVYEGDHAARNPSPKFNHHLDDLIAPPLCPMADLVAQLDQHHLYRNPPCPTHGSTPLPPPSPSLHHSSAAHSHDSPQPTYSRIAASVLRRQRQSHSRLQCTASHIRDISALVRMMEAQEKYTHFESIKSRTWSSSTTSSTESTMTVSDSDEESDTESSPPRHKATAVAAMQAWRPDGKADGYVRVTKMVRMRRHTGNGVVKRGRS